MKRYILIILIIVITAAAYFADFFIKKGDEVNENILLKQENQQLLAQVQRSVLFGKNSGENGNLFVAKVFSSYPFNIKNTITVSGGKNDGIKENMAATLGQNIFVGRVSKVFDDYSIVQTVFDPSWQMSVRMGAGEVDGLFQGGNEPRVTLIEKNKPLEAGDIVYSASKDFPYGLKIGEVSEIKEDSAGVFKEAILKMPFNVNELREINILFLTKLQ